MPKGKDFCRVESGVFVSCPELCFVQLAQSLPFHELVRAGNVLCGRFYLDAGKGGELGRREPLTSKRRIEAFIRANPGIKGVKEARRRSRGLRKVRPLLQRRFSLWCSGCLTAMAAFSSQTLR